MYTLGTKKMTIVYILELLKENSDKNHKLSQQDIIKLLDRNYNMSCDRKTVKSNLTSLIEYGFPIKYDEIIRMNRNQEEEIILTDFYFEHDFTETELKHLINSILFSKELSTEEAEKLISKVKGLSSKYFKTKLKHVSNLPELQHTDNKEVMRNLELIDEAIEKNKQISFIYNRYGIDLKLHPKRNETYLVNPYKIVANNSRYYLICNYDKYDDISHYRIDRITDLTIISDSRAKPQKEVKGLENGLNLPKHLAEHIYMFTGETDVVKLSIDKGIMSEVIDWFGKDLTIMSENEQNATIRIKCNKQAMFFWAMQYGMYVEVLSPADLRKQIQDAIINLENKYK